MSRSSLYLVLAILAVVVVGFAGYMVYQEQQKPGLEIKVDGNGLQVNGG
jgi:hypothetical protein